MVNPKNSEQWLHIEESLLAIARNTYISDQVDMNIQDKYEEYQNPIEFEDEVLRVNLSLFSNKMVVQKNIV